MPVGRELSLHALGLGLELGQLLGDLGLQLVKILQVFLQLFSLVLKIYLHQTTTAARAGMVSSRRSW